MADFGTDLSCVADIDAGGATVTGTRIVAEALARRLFTPRGRLLDDPDYGWDLTAYLNDDITRSGLAELQAMAAAECLKDERVLDCTVTATLTASGLLSVLVLFTTADGPFELVVAVTATSVELLSVT